MRKKLDPYHSHPAAFEKNRITGSSEALASSGASSTIVYNMSELVISAIFFISKLAVSKNWRPFKQLSQKGQPRFRFVLLYRNLYFNCFDRFSRNITQAYGCQ